MLPIKDNNPTTITPWVTYAIIAINVVVFLGTVTLDPRATVLMNLQYGAIPAVLFGHAELPPGFSPFPAGFGFLSIFSAMFMHGGWMHLGGNMLYLWIFGNNVEDSMGHFRFLVFYLACGVAAALGHGLLDTQSEIPMIGASGALAGVLGAYFLLYPKARVLVWFFWVFIFYVPAVVVLGFWFVSQVINFGSGAGGGIAWVAHIAGFLAGLALIPLFKHRNVPLWHDGSPAPAFGIYRPGRKTRGSTSNIPPWAATYEAERAARHANMRRDQRGPWGKDGEDRDTSPWGRYQPKSPSEAKPKPKPKSKPSVGLPKVVRLHPDRNKDDT
ncbi:rhomboid family intramembrane serine protease [Thalassospira sp. HF15]|uniref:rhomboid family intramembrane serine protease n=1 Tax=Thalassospira sp. HF15 TaxID=2722755 RepID=UPI00142FB475|nr:rhomboid family intramembrane serine protease [Thalassospira sp. HF15]NIY75362.1 rhomboid family intramembrane serine protease [Thalassospira sp. HF15]